MKIETFKYENVLPNGTFASEAGAVEINGKVIMSQNNGSCDLKGCQCSERHWLTIIKPRTEHGIVEGISVSFESQFEMQKFFDERELVCG